MMFLPATLFLVGFFCAVSIAMLLSKRFREEFGFSDYMMLLLSVVLLMSFLLSLWSETSTVDIELFRRDPALLLVALPAAYVGWLLVRFLVIDPFGRKSSND